ncbi:MAG: hypothetical protein QOG53_562 [Frankiales bacterium]|nr:hypothetical protein [Frankiales bacterium]
MSKRRRNARLLFSGRGTRLLLGVALIAEALALNVRSELGLGPLFIVFQGLSRHGLATIGIAAVATNAVLLIWQLGLRDRPGLGTLAQVFLLGPITDLCLLATPGVSSTAMQVTYLSASLVILSFGAALYLSADLGAGPWDAVMRGLYRRSRRLSLALIRALLECSAVVVGWLLGGDVGVGTVAIGLGIGPGIAVFLRVLGAMPERLATGEVLAPHLATDPRSGG